MYETLFSLSTNPFSLTPNPAFLYLTQEHRDAIAGMMYGILARKGIVVLSGDAGTGKTTLIRSMMRSIPSARAEFSFVLNPLLSADEFLLCALAKFGIDGKKKRKHELLSSLHKHLLDAHQERRSVVLIVDEAHRMSPELLEEIRLLANYETDTDKLLQILLVGQDELDLVLDRHDLRQLKQRVAIRMRINRLTNDQVSEYIRHRWNKATCKALPFDTEALRSIAECAGGIPRVVNAICDNTLIYAIGQGSRTVSKVMVLEVARNLHMGPSKPTNGREGANPRAIAIDDVPAGSNSERLNIEPANGASRLASLEGRAPLRRWPFRWGTRPQGV